MCPTRLWFGACFAAALAVASTASLDESLAQFDSSLARTAILYASAAYCGQSVWLRKWVCSPCKKLPRMTMQTVFHNDTTAAFGFVGIDAASRRIVLAFRGTVFSEVSSVVDDVKFFRTPYPESIKDSTVHRGFLEYLQSVQDDIRPSLTRAVKQNPNFDVWITGHSLGAAVAVLAAVEFNDIVPNAIVYTFGTPRVGNYIFAQHFDSLYGARSFRIIHWRDIVARMPPCSWDPFLSSCIKDKAHPYHTVTEVLYDDEMTKFTVCSRSDGEDELCSDRFSSVMLSISDHRYYFGRDVGQVCHGPPPPWEPLVDVAVY